MPRQIPTDEYGTKFRGIMLEMDIYDKPNHRQTYVICHFRQRVDSEDKGLT